MSTPMEYRQEIHYLKAEITNIISKVIIPIQVSTDILEQESW